MNFPSITKTGSVGHLVDPRPIFGELIKKRNKILFCTVSPNPNLKVKTLEFIKGREREYKTNYDAMTHPKQYNYLKEYYEEVYLKLLEGGDKAIAIFEINNTNNLHMHILIYSKEIQSDYDIKAFQKAVYAHYMTQRNISKKGKMRIDYMNNIVYADDPLDLYDNYMTKQQDIKQRYPDLIFGM